VRYLNLDLGASRIKWVIYSDSGIVESGTFLNPYSKFNNSVEIKISELGNIIYKLVESSIIQFNIEKVLVSSQMHGFAIINNNNEFLSEYVSWLDQRFVSSKSQLFESIKNDLGSSFHSETGMAMKGGLPFFNSISVLNFINESEIKLISLPEVILMKLGIKTPLVHSTIFAGTGFYNIRNKTISDDLFKFHSLITGKKLIFNDVENSCKAFETAIAGKPILVSIGYGDHQCAVLGSKNDFESISVNLGTGSQVSKIVKSLDRINFSNEFQYRPFFNNMSLLCKTHIPSGRALNVFVNFLSSISTKNVWDDIERLSIESLDKASLKFDLANFKDAYKYDLGGSISLISEDEFTYENFLASLVKTYLFQYVEIINSIDESSKSPTKKIIFSGGLSKKLLVIESFYKFLFKYDISIASNNYDEDEAIIGLKILNTYEN